MAYRQGHLAGRVSLLPSYSQRTRPDHLGRGVYLLDPVPCLLQSLRRLGPALADRPRRPAGPLPTSVADCGCTSGDGGGPGPKGKASSRSAAPA
ncbi:hypothetical protein MPLA_290051 [Mesorhizobium sp. ORS 3359]|nr:hypothetical protein MPLA_290051 [Mesorhizobium sp. ORS 3359]